ncbi:MAG: tripartite tricarboxylate transporter substrate binding protein [Candidatus Methylomirabilales bacterium]
MKRWSWLTLAFFSLSPLVVQAAEYPTKPIHLIIPFKAGGSADTEGRVIAKAAEKILGQPVVPVNKPGAGGGIAYTFVKNAKPDGYTVAWNSTSVLTSTNLGTAPFPYTALDHVARVSMQSMPIAVKADSPWKTIQEFIAYAKKNPGMVRVGNASPGSATHITAVAVADAVGIKVIHVPLGSGRRIPALLRGEVEAVCVPLPEAAKHVQAGTVRLLAVPSERRDPLAPDVPTLKELGYPAAIELFRGLSVPKGTPPAVIQKLAEAFRQAAHSAQFKAMGQKRGYSVAYLGPDEFSTLLATQNALIAKTVKKAGIKAKKKKK